MIDHKLLEELKEYIDFHLHLVVYESSFKLSEPILEECHSFEIDDFIKKNKKPSLQELLFQYIDERELNDAAVYKKAGMDRRHFSKIRSNPDYKPRKTTVIALALALELDSDCAEEFLNAGGYSLSGSERYDLAIRFFLERGIYDMQSINETLDYLSLKTF
ncbi:hypothetical protein JOC95_001479 [Bacillus tianshenii]|uniref:XRE family transcriptional regulator n=1 Tax=Sutcliffiella tianshenii TaxID=1463404 RepID=A0ABS2NYA4_9BACI|nr:hypothetical protein [Bacillus tianshenii]MBM7619627.1 hypothetical protein [Bacillus tianshenii]